MTIEITAFIPQTLLLFKEIQVILLLIYTNCKILTNYISLCYHRFRQRDYMRKNNVLNEEIERYLPFIEALVQLFHPFMEAAVHDLKAGKIVALYHNISQRKIGEATPLQELHVKTEKFPDYFMPYYKQNWDGRPLKCTSITLRDNNGEAIGLICFNVDTSFFQEARNTLNRFLNIDNEGENPIEMFGEGCQEHINQIIGEYLNEHHLTLHYLKRNHKKDLVHKLYRAGIFNYKNAVPYAAQQLKLSRASIYNYLKEMEE